LGKTSEVLHPFLKQPPDDPGLLFAWGELLSFERVNPAWRRKSFAACWNKIPAILPFIFFSDRRTRSKKIIPIASLQLKSALQLDPRLPEAHYFMGLVHLRQSDFESAAAEFRSELAIRPGDPAASYHLGFSLLMDGHPDQAVTIFREVVRAKPIMKWPNSNSDARFYSKEMRPALSKVLKRPESSTRIVTHLLPIESGLPPRRSLA